MARLNITIPDPLYERLKRWESNMNASKVCTRALAAELDSIEGQPVTTDPDIQRAIERLRSAPERWRERGYQDGRQWAVDVASRDEMSLAADREIAASRVRIMQGMNSGGDVPVVDLD